MKQNKKIAVIGSGISGISAASVLKENYDVTVYERSEYIGGLVHCDRVDDYLYHRVGGHVFNSKNKQVLDWFWSKFDKEKEFIQAKRNAKILYGNSFIGYPIENFLYQLDSVLMEKIIAELLEINSHAVLDPMDYSDFEEFLKGNFGNTLYDFYFKPYNEKIWKTDLKTVPMHWLEGKLPMPKLQEVITSNIKREAEGSMVHALFFYPKYGGSQFIAERLSQGLNIQTKHTLEHIECLPSGKLRLFGQEYDGVIYTGDVRQLPSILHTNGEQQFLNNSQITSLRSNGTSSILCSCDANDLSWLYIPESRFKAHRIIYTGNFSATNNKQDLSGRTSCTVEFSGICSLEEMKQELEYLPGNLKFIDYNTEPNSYVVQDPQTRKVIKEYKEYLEKYHIHILGRFGEWEYYNMDKAMEAAFRIKDQLISQK